MKKYTIALKIRRGNSFIKKLNSVLYYSGSSKTDNIDFRSSLIRISCERSKSIDGNSMLTNGNSSVFKQIMKVLLLYGAVNRNNASLHRLTIVKNANVAIEDIGYKVKDQPVTWNNIVFNKSFDNDRLAHYLFETTDGDKLSNILSHWIVGISTTNRHSKFESLWRAFEQLCDFHNRTMLRRNEFENLKSMRQFLDTNKGLFPHTTSLLSTKDYTWLRRFQWKQLIYNNYPLTGSNKLWENYRDNFVLQNNDHRIIQLIRDTLVYREVKLISSGVKVDIDNHINIYTTTHVVDDVQLAAFMCCKYAYFVRNKMFHGEMYEKNFRFYHATDDDWQLDELNKILETLTFELIDNFALL